MTKVKKPFLSIFIAIVGTLIAGLVIEYIREHKSIPFIYQKDKSAQNYREDKQQTSNDNIDNSKILKIETNDFSTEYWKQNYFKAVKKDTWNVIVKSIGSDYSYGKRELDKLISKYPKFYFRLTYTVNKDASSNKMYAIYFGNGLNLEEAQTAINIAKKYKIANDAYMIKQHWDSNNAYQ